jgi:hypothetical protein
MKTDQFLMYKSQLYNLYNRNSVSHVTKCLLIITFGITITITHEYIYKFTISELIDVCSFYLYVII